MHCDVKQTRVSPKPSKATKFDRNRPLSHLKMSHSGAQCALLFRKNFKVIYFLGPFRAYNNLYNYIFDFIIQPYILSLDVGKETSSTPESNFKTRMKGTFNIGKQDDLLKDINKKLQRMLEETLMKNVELQKVFKYL